MTTSGTMEKSDIKQLRLVSRTTSALVEEVFSSAFFELCSVRTSPPESRGLRVGGGTRDIGQVV